jgi:hypothetical protein
MPLNDRELNGMVDWLVQAAPYVSLHSADPGPDGANETSALRDLANWSDPVHGLLLLQDQLFSGGEPNGPATHVGLWSQPTGGLFYGSGQLTGDLRFNANGAYHVASLTINGASSG